MRSKLSLISTSTLRGLQILFAIIVLCLSVTLTKNYNRSKDADAWENPRPPTILTLATAVGGLSLIAAVFNLVVAWTECLREYIEMLVDVVVILANIVAGTVCITVTRKQDFRLTFREAYSHATPRHELQR
jgi:hypothetical protein